MRLATAPVTARDAVRAAAAPEPLEVRAARLLAEHGFDYTGPWPGYGQTIRGADRGKGRANRALALTRTADALLVYGHASGIGLCVRDDGRDAGLTPAERQRVRVAAKRAERAARADEDARTARAIGLVRGLCRVAEPCIAHPYLEHKGTPVVPGLLVDRDGWLLVPRRDTAGRVVALQRIAPAPTGASWPKLYSAGTPTRATLFGVGRVDPEGTVLVAEGLATGLTVHAETGHPVAVAFDAGNLLAVAERLRAKYPAVRIVLAADDDRQTENNPGRTKAAGAARAVGGRVALPPLCRCCTCSDFNDLAACERRRGAA